MCGILAALGQQIDYDKVKSASKLMAHRGPDESDYVITSNGFMLCHERLSIIDIHSGKQPIQGTSEAYMIHNGEIYNHKELKAQEFPETVFRTTSDSEVIVHLYEKYGDDFLNRLDGVFAFVVADQDQFIVARDPIGVKPLYYGYDDLKQLYVASEMKALMTLCTEVHTFPPGHYYTPEKGFVQYFKPQWFEAGSAVKSLQLYKIREALESATEKRLMSDVPVGVLLSGGLDSSLTSAIATRLLKKQGKSLKSFSIGLDKESPDLKAAKKVADFLGTEHHEIHFTIEEGIAAIKKLIWHLETYDVTSVRASTPMYLMSKYIREQGVKVVLSGEGADEIFGGYLYFRNAPTLNDFQKETIERVQKLATADCLRADKSTMAFGLEARVPFLDKSFLETAMTITPSHKQPKTYEGIEKYILRKAFDTPEEPYLPKEVLWRQKEQFSDGVGYSWIDTLIAHCEAQITDEQMATAEQRFPINTPTTKEAYVYRTIFEEYFPLESAARTVKKWIPKWQENTDPSGRANASHHQADVTIAQGLKKEVVY